MYSANGIETAPSHTRRISSYRFWRPYRASAITLARMNLASSHSTSFVTLARPSIVRITSRQSFAYQPIDQRAVGGKNILRRQLLRRDPGHVGDLDGARLAYDPARIDEHDQIELGIGVEEHVPDPADGRGHAELLVQLA